MLEIMDDLPPEIAGLRAVGKVSKADYDDVFEPVLERAHQNHRRLRFLYELGETFEGFTAAAMWEDAKLGLRYLRLFEACAVVTDSAWIRQTVAALGFLVPCPVRIFATGDRDEAVRWLLSETFRSIRPRLLADRGVIVAEIDGPLHADDFDALATTADTWIDHHGRLDGLVVHARGVPGWENVEALLRHVRFIRNHHEHIRRIAVAVDGKVAAIAPRIADRFVKAEIRKFSYDELDAAIEWASQAPENAEAEEAPRKRA